LKSFDIDLSHGKGSFNALVLLVEERVGCRSAKKWIRAEKEENDEDKTLSLFRNAFPL
jgi:hypothetical protein